MKGFEDYAKGKYDMIQEDLGTINDITLYDLPPKTVLPTYANVPDDVDETDIPNQHVITQGGKHYCGNKVPVEKRFFAPYPWMDEKIDIEVQVHGWLDCKRKGKNRTTRFKPYKCGPMFVKAGEMMYFINHLDRFEYEVGKRSRPIGEINKQMLRKLIIGYFNTEGCHRRRLPIMARQSSPNDFDDWYFDSKQTVESV